jgi:hypothetical protein
VSVGWVPQIELEEFDPAAAIDVEAPPGADAPVWVDRFTLTQAQVQALGS